MGNAYECVVTTRTPTPFTTHLRTPAGPKTQTRQTILLTMTLLTMALLTMALRTPGLSNANSSNNTTYYDTPYYGTAYYGTTHACGPSNANSPNKSPKVNSPGR